MLKRYKEKYGYKRLIKEYNSLKRNTIVCNLADAKSVGIIWNATSTENLDTIKKFVSDLQKQNKQVLALGYIDDKEKNGLEMQTPEFIFFNKKNLNWHYKPIDEDTTAFIKSKFDIVIDFDFNNILPIKYVTVWSNASFKVGKNDGTSPNFYDLSLAINSETSNELSYFIEQLKKYLNMVKPQ